MTQVNGFNPFNSYVVKNEQKPVTYPEHFTVTNPIVPHIKAALPEDAIEGENLRPPLRKLTFAEKIGEKAIDTALSMKSIGYCFRGVKNSLKEFGIKLWGGSAYMAADQLAKNEKFKEIEVKKEDLKNLDKGCVVVWDNSTKHPHGHISVSLGGGKEASDHIQNQIQNYGTSFRVFKPVEEV